MAAPQSWPKRTLNLGLNLIRGISPERLVPDCSADIVHCHVEASKAFADFRDDDSGAFSRKTQCRSAPNSLTGTSNQNSAVIKSFYMQSPLQSPIIMLLIIQCVSHSIAKSGCCQQL